MDNETLQALERIESGGGNDHDRAIVRRALLNVAPSSQAYKRLSRAAGVSAMSGFGDITSGGLPGADSYGGPVAGSTQLPFSGQQRPSPPGQPDGMFGTPTLDFLGSAAGRMPAQPGADPAAPTDLVGAARAGVGPNIADAYQPGPSPNLDAVGQFMGRMDGPSFDWGAGLATRGGDAVNQSDRTYQAQRKRDMVPEIPPAAEADAQGSAPIGSNAPPHAGMSEAFYNAMSGRNSDPEMAGFDQPPGMDENSPADIFSQMPSGYSFSDMNRAGIQDMLTNPERYATTFARGHGGEQYAQMYTDPARAAIALSESGIYGPGGTSIGNNMQSTTGMPIGQRLQAVEDFMNQYTTKGTDIRPEEIYRQMYGRLSNTDLSQITSPQTHLPMDTGEIIDYTNKSLMAAAPFMTPEGQSWISSILANAGNKYMDYIGSTDEAEPMSYPAFLRSIGVDKLMQGEE